MPRGKTSDSEYGLGVEEISKILVEGEIFTLGATSSRAVPIITLPFESKVMKLK